MDRSILAIQILCIIVFADKYAIACGGKSNTSITDALLIEISNSGISVRAISMQSFEKWGSAVF